MSSTLFVLVTGKPVLNGRMSLGTEAFSSLHDSRAIFYRPETTLAAADSAKAASPTPDITLYYWVSKLHAMSSRE